MLSAGARVVWSRGASRAAVLRSMSTVSGASDGHAVIAALGGAHVNGRWTPSASGATFDVVDPASLSHIGTVPDMNASDTRAAIEVANAALPSWRSTTAKERAVLLRRWYDLVMEHQSALAELITLESGKPKAESMGEVAYGAAFLEWFSEEARRTNGQVIPTHDSSKRIVVMKQPVGVCAFVTPWNFPNAMITRKAGAALAAGCTAVLKPAEDTPLSALALSALATEAGIPDGVLNVVTASRSNSANVGNELCESKTIRKLSFTGSTAVGKALYRGCADTVKRISLELGGNAPFVVFDDADVDKAVEGAMAAKFRNAGQTCVCANRLLVQSGIYDEFAEKFSAAVSALAMGHGLTAGVQVGPVINEAAAHKFDVLLSDATAKGASTTLGGGRGDKQHGAGYFCEPTVLRDITEDMHIYGAEIFGPIAPLFKFETEEEAVELSNQFDSGLAGYFFTSDLARAWRVAEALEVGMVGVNTGLVSTEVAPFGGVKESGLGREGSTYGIDEYLEIKYVCMGVE